MKNNRLYLDIHVLQNVPPSCINRDDTGSPKTAIYGGVTRARVSSQSWKRAIRLSFRDMLSWQDLGERTKRIIPMVAEEIQKLDASADTMALARKVLEAADIGIKAIDDKKNNDKADVDGTGALFFMSHRQAEALAKLALQATETKDKTNPYKAALNSQPSVDMALFGRMVASDPSLNIDAACQVAHSISTHAVRNEFDYFTAVDDRAPDDNAGAGHIGTVEFNSSVLYRYATVNLCDLEQKLGKEDAIRATQAFVEAFVCAMPTGKQSTFANRTLPDMVYLTLRCDQPINMVGAFEKPVRPYDGGLMEPSIKALKNYAHDICEKYGIPPEAELDLGGDITGQSAGGLKCMLESLSSLLEKKGEL